QPHNPGQQQPHNPGQQPKNPAQQTGQQQPGNLLPDWVTRNGKPIETVVQNLLGKYNRSQRTLRDAATRHLIATDQFDNLASKLRDAKLPGGKTLGALVDGLGDKLGDAKLPGGKTLGSLADRLGKSNLGDTLRDAKLPGGKTLGALAKNLGGTLKDAKLPGGKTLGALAKGYSNWRYKQAMRYGSMSHRLDQLANQKSSGLRNPFKKATVKVLDRKTGLPKTTTMRGFNAFGIHGHLPEKLQRAANWTGGDWFNRIKPGKTLDKVRGALGLRTDDARFPEGKNPRLAEDGPKESPAVKAARAAAKTGGEKFPIAENIKRIGGMRLAETGRRVLTKAAGPVTVGFGALDVADQVRHGKSLASAIGKTGSGIAASSLAYAGAAAVIPGGGWAVAGGIVASAYVSDAWSRSGAGEAVGKGIDKAGKAFSKGDVVGGLGEAGKGVVEGGKKFGVQVGKDAVNLGKGAVNLGKSAWHSVFG
ncbi:MAG: hypothetical protein J2P19_28115, partial [Pseudonocardia sp.]|nr:hypothetical protein [Pseudonocardia sp.]